MSVLQQVHFGYSLFINVNDITRIYKNETFLTWAQFYVFQGIVLYCVTTNLSYKFNWIILVTLYFK